MILFTVLLSRLKPHPPRNTACGQMLALSYLNQVVNLLSQCKLRRLLLLIWFAKTSS
uniref:Uncharacterized protein n=1 Tax=Rhizophora mucronata TaxID=61149 RepID=A0A2P2NJM3_RHIMU